MKHPTFIVSRLLESTRDFLRYVARQGFSVHLVEGNSSLEKGLRAFRQADRLWFEGIGPLFLELVDRPYAAWFPRVVLRIKGSEISRLPAPSCWWLVSDLIVSSEREAEEIRALGPFHPHRVRIHVIPSAHDLDLLRGNLPWEESEDLLRVLQLPADGSTLEEWKLYLQVASHCQGKVLIHGPVPDEFVEHLRTGLGCEVVCDQEGLACRPVDTLVLWEGLDTDTIAEALRLGLERLRPDGSLIGLGRRRPRTNEVGSYDLARLVRGATA